MHSSLLVWRENLIEKNNDRNKKKRARMRKAKGGKKLKAVKAVAPAQQNRPKEGRIVLCVKKKKKSFASQLQYCRGLLTNGQTAGWSGEKTGHRAFYPNHYNHLSRMPFRTNE